MNEENTEEDPKCEHGIPLISRVGGPNNYCAKCEAEAKFAKSFEGYPEHGLRYTDLD